MKRILNLNDLEEIKQKKQSGKKIVLVGGCFDIIHLGHIEFLKKAKALGDILVVLLESDQTVKNLKGKQRPINSQKERAIILSSIKGVDYVISIPPFKTNEKYESLVKTIEPDIIAVSSEDPMLELKKKHAERVKGKVLEVIKRIEEFSTSRIAEQLKK